MLSKSIGSVILIEHGGKPTAWPVQATEIDDTKQLLEMFDAAIAMCETELLGGGCLKVFDCENRLIKEQRGFVNLKGESND